MALASGVAFSDRWLFFVARVPDLTIGIFSTISQEISMNEA
jgi:hypothetical protein